MDLMPVDISSIQRDPDRVVLLNEEEVTGLLKGSLELFRNEPYLLHIDRGKTLFVGDTHGNFDATKVMVKEFTNGDFDRIVFLGDYVDRGKQQLENINFLIALKLAQPKKVLLLRGNHETVSTNFRYGFHEAVTGQYTEALFRLYNRVFSYLPLAALTWNDIFVVHGGIAKGLERLSQIESLPRGEPEPSGDIVPQLLWNDPAEGIEGFAYNDQRGGFYYYGQDVCLKFMDENHLKGLLRSHEVFNEGYKYFFDGRLLSIFSSTGYFGAPIKGKAAQLSEDGKVDLIEVVI
jgi:protein phosphatase